jgi:hypothetical protein
LNTVGTIEDLARQQIELYDGLILTFYSDDTDSEGALDKLVVEGVVRFSDDEDCWVAEIDWTAIRHSSDRPIKMEER